MRKLEHRAVEVKILAGSKYANPLIPDMIGRGTVICASIFEDTAPSKKITIGLEDVNGSKLVPHTHRKDWFERNGGDYISSKKPIDLPVGQLKVVAQATEDLTADYIFDLQLVIDRNQY